jgi:spore coat polysaccharide biosynthesis predicted glycosyltransferase SpsG
MIVFRTDASQKTGFGHLNRSAYLASLLKSKCGVLFCVNQDKAVTRFLEEKRLPFCSLKELERLKDPEVKSVVFDLRSFSDDDLRLLRRAREEKLKTVQITDLGLSQQDTDYTVDGSIITLFPYPGEKSNNLLFGPEFAILHHRFRHFNKIARKYRKAIRNVFICFGGGVTYRHLRQAVDLLTRHGFEVKIAPGFYLKKNSPKTLRRIYPKVHFVGKTQSLARAFFEADAAIITSGVAAYEAAAVGTPALYFYYHDEQKSIAQAFQNKGAGLEISDIDDLLHVDLIDKMKTLTVEKRIEMGLNGKQLVDAGGVYRVIDFFERNHII